MDDPCEFPAKGSKGKIMAGITQLTLNSALIEINHPTFKKIFGGNALP